MILSDKTYNALRWVALICIPALATAYATLGKIWDLPYTSEIPATITALGVLLGALLQISTANYHAQETEPEVVDDGE